MEWSLTQSKLLAFHRLMRTDKPIGALLLLWPTLWALWVATLVYRNYGYWRCLSPECG